ncbi:Cyclic di-GMP phosphodiesterase Gmr [Rubripirellula obstinata]|uniref:Cyclic di-GMP phosphodiesterase Gmr n=1 Tax=Rubripirellula obstinata TaxID=406547 RepID=A0A5B1CF18_9BACT|nr:EAL domain-containing protein [Rubripirellula obstinata]KAA1258339.1 Cyclic di-GMP phosphodiesterase Gmr [Rubripirellula obstinata]
MTSRLPSPRSGRQSDRDDLGEIDSPEMQPGMDIAMQPVVQVRSKLVSTLAIIFVIMVAINEIIQRQIIAPEIAILAPSVGESQINQIFWNARLPYIFFSISSLLLMMLLMQRFILASFRQVAELGREIERRRLAEREMRIMAHRDALTQLPNRPYLIERLQEIIRTRKPNAVTRDAVLFLDLDNFKIINDSLGHDAGDDLLGQVAGRLQQCVRKHDTASRVCADKNESETVRLGGDEFVVLLERLMTPEDALDVANRIVRRISEPFSISGRLVTVGTSIGIAYVNKYTKDAHDALRNADTAMYRAKHAGKGQVAVFDKSMHEDVVMRMERESQLRRAIHAKDFELHYQPIVNLVTAQVQGVEVLLRWKDDSGQYVSPSEFVPMIEEIGLIGEVGEWVLEKSMTDINGVLQSVPADVANQLSVGVNMSPRQLADPFFLDQLDEIIDRTQFDRRRLSLEMNEAQDVRHGDRVRAALLKLNESGVGILIDDFGKGQSSLTSFQNYPIEGVKIDRSFTRSIANDHTHAVIAEAIVELAHHLSATIVAEGVESKDQLLALQAWGCDAAQGYLFSPPLSRDDLAGFLSDPSHSEGIKLLRESAQCDTQSVGIPVGIGLHPLDAGFLPTEI